MDTEALQALRGLQYMDLKKIQEVAKFLESPEGTQLLESMKQPNAVNKLDPYSKDFDAGEFKKVKQNEYDAKRLQMFGDGTKTNKGQLGLLRQAMGLSPQALAIKAAFAIAGEAPGAVGDIYASNKQSNAERALVGGQTEGQRKSWGISPFDIAQQRYASNEQRKGRNGKRIGDAVGNVFKSVAGAYNAGDTAARMQLAAGGDRLSTGGYWALNKMLGLQGRGQ